MTDGWIRRRNPLAEHRWRICSPATAALTRARARRHPLEIDLPERQIVLSDEGRRKTSVAFKGTFRRA